MGCGELGHRLQAEHWIVGEKRAPRAALRSRQRLEPVLAADLANEPFALEASVVNMVNAVCGDANGSIEVMPMGGTGPYEYAWSNGDDAAMMNALPGDYSVTITDANGCTWTMNKSVCAESLRSRATA